MRYCCRLLSFGCGFVTQSVYDCGFVSGWHCFGPLGSRRKAAFACVLTFPSALVARILEFCSFHRVRRPIVVPSASQRSQGNLKHGPRRSVAFTCGRAARSSRAFLFRARTCPFPWTVSRSLLVFGYVSAHSSTATKHRTEQTCPWGNLRHHM